MVLTSKAVTFATVRWATTDPDAVNVTEKNTNGNGNGNGNGKCKRTEVTYDELMKLIESDSVQLFDVREPKEVEQVGRIPGAVNVPLTQLKGSLTDENFEARFHAPCPTKTGDNLIFYGLRSVKGSAAVEIAHKLGFKKAKHFPGGWEEWCEKQLQTKPETPDSKTDGDSKDETPGKS